MSASDHAFELLTVEETAAMLRTTPKAVYLMVQRGQLGAGQGVVRLGRRLLFQRDALLRSLDPQRRA